MCTTTEPRDAIEIAIDAALRQHGGLRDVLRGDIDPVAIACSAADRAGNCTADQAALAAVLLLATETIRRQREQIVLLEFQAMTNALTVREITRENAEAEAERELYGHYNGGW